MTAEKIYKEMNTLLSELLVTDENTANVIKKILNSNEGKLNTGCFPFTFAGIMQELKAEIIKEESKKSGKLGDFKAIQNLLKRAGNCSQTVMMSG